jgi:microcystin-dependent protein
LPIAENETLFQLIGTTYGGDGEATFALPDLRGRLPLHQGNGFILAETGGVEDVTLTVTQVPAHSPPFLATTNLADQVGASNNVLGQLTQGLLYFAAQGASSLNAASIAQAGGSQPHTNFQPYLCINFIISLLGIFPSPT